MRRCPSAPPTASCSAGSPIRGRGPSRATGSSGERSGGSLGAPGAESARGIRGAGVWEGLGEVNDGADSYYDSEGGPGYEYRLFAVNVLGEEVLLGEASIDARPATVTLAAWPMPYTNGKMNITFAVVGDGVPGSHARANVGVYNVAGRLVRTVATGTYPAGVHDVSWNGKDERGRMVAPGVYFLRAITGERTDVRKVVVVR